MKFLPLLAFIFLSAWIMSSCKSSSKPPVFCDTTCNNNRIEFTYPHPDTPFVAITIKDCIPDSIIWSHEQLATNRKMHFEELVGRAARINKDYVRVFFNDTSYAWLQFNDCITKRGFLVKLPYNKEDKWTISTSALNNLDPKFNVEDGLLAYYTEMFIYVQDWKTGQVQQMKLNDTRLEINHDKVHDTFDSVNITRSKIWANVTIGGEKVVKEKNIQF